ncbi:MAG: recombinase RecT [Novosphingobium sp.]|jgi:phage recombination protein Bet|nr:recombinase RecT [Novosphingobium sp.]
MQTARAAAVASESRQIDESTSRALAAAEQRDRPRNALQAISERYGMSAGKLVDTLRATVFSAARSEAEFNALVVVANEYKLNPLLKEIYAFPARGQGIVPMVSVDGWIRIMNEHPDFDGIEFVYHADAQGEIEAIESIIHHKRRAHPIHTTEFMVECRRDSEPWKKSPRRMLRHRALMQGARIAFGFAGIYVEDDTAIEGSYADRGPVSLPPAQQWDEPAGIVDAATGEVQNRDERGFSQVDEETARQLDAAAYPAAAPALDTPLAEKVERKIRKQIAEADSLPFLASVERDFINAMAAFPEEAVAEIEGLIRDRRRALTGGEG